MPPTQVTAYNAYYQPGITKVYIVDDIADYTAPTRVELDAGLDVTRQVRSIDGWTVAADQIERPDMASLFTSKIGGRTSADDSSLTIYAARNGVDVRSTLVQGYTGFVVFLDGGDVTGYKMDVYPVLVISRPKQRGDSDPMTTQYQFSITQPPAEDVAIPS
ncbi:hypothetical protein [Pseudonocardia sp.]|uniref:phage tail tube protein n=1 Tax=Pseudonocardia sp. TaxID=60912 RepID=UPI003D10C362